MMIELLPSAHLTVYFFRDGQKPLMSLFTQMPTGVQSRQWRLLGH
ncbi:hypothetical protein [Moraxella lacunata]